MAGYEAIGQAPWFWSAYHDPAEILFRQIGETYEKIDRDQA
jgi:hypothetical protein